MKVIQLNDNAAEWTAISTSGENLRVERGYVDPNDYQTNEYFLFGGASDTNIADTTYKLIPVDGGENPSFKWKKITLPEEDTLKPEGRRGHTVTAWKEDGGIEKMVLFGGCDSENKCFNDVWIFKTEEEKWEKFEITGATMPAARSKHDAFIRTTSCTLWWGKG